MKKSKYVLNVLVILLLTLAGVWFALKDNYRQVLDAISLMNLISLDKALISLVKEVI